MIRRRDTLAALLVVTALLAVPDSAPAAGQTIGDPSGDAPAAGASGERTDLRSATISQDASNTTVSVSVDPAATFEGFVFLDTTADGRADYTIKWKGDASAVTVGVATDKTSTAGCQQTSAPTSSDTPADTKTEPDGRVTWSKTFPTSAIGDATSFNWAAYGTTPQDKPPDGFDYLPDSANPDPTGANPSDRTCTLGAGSGIQLDLAKGGSFPPTEQPPPPQPPPAPPPHPTAHFSLGAGGSQAGALTTFDGSGSAPSPGQHIVSYLWDFNNDGHVDANTGSSSLAAIREADSGTHTVGLQVEDSGGLYSDFVTQTFTTGDAQGGCRSSLTLGWLDLVAGCIRQDGRRYTMDLTSGASLNGITLASGPGARLTLDTTGDRWSLSANATVRVQLENTPIGTITLFERDLRASPIYFGAGANSADRDAPGLLLGRIAVDHSCHTSVAPPPVVCARLPGGFPLTGTVSLYLTPPDSGGPPGLAVVAHAELSRPFTITGEVQIGADTDTGVHIDSFEFVVEGMDIGVGRVDRLRLAYTRLADNGDLDVWEGSASATLRTPTPAGLDGSFRFANGRFNRAALRLRGAHVPVGPGIFLNTLGASVGIDPFRLGGTLGAGFGPADITGEFLYENTRPQHIHAGGTFSLLGAELASAHFDYWTNGDIEFGGRFHYYYPSPATRVVGVNASIAGWFQASRFQLEGAGEVVTPVFVGNLGLLVNTDWVAGCGLIQVRNPFDPDHGWGPQIGGYLGIPRHGGDAQWGLFSCDLGRFRIAPGAHGAMQKAAGGERTVTLPRGLPSAEFELSSGTGVPAVTIRGPRGETITSSSDLHPPVRQGAFSVAQSAGEHRLYVFVKNPSAGTWRIAPAPGSPNITQVRQAFGTPAPSVHAHVTGHGRQRTLVYTMRPIAGARVTFVEDGSDTMHPIGTATGSHGRIRFTPTDGSGRARRILATVEVDGVPRKAIVAGSYTAPAQAVPGRPGKASAKRKGEGVTVTWKAAKGAASYSIFVVGSDGRRVAYSTAGRTRSLRITNVTPDTRLVVTIRGETARTHLAGRPRQVVAAAVRAKPRRRGGRQR